MIRSSSARTGMRVWRHDDLTGPEVTNASYPGSSVHGAVNSDAVPKDLDRMIDAALDRGAEVLWDDAGHRTAMQVTADRVEKLNGREFGIIEADQAAFAKDRPHPDPSRPPYSVPRCERARGGHRSERPRGRRTRQGCARRAPPRSRRTGRPCRRKTSTRCPWTPRHARRRGRWWRRHSRSPGRFRWRRPGFRTVGSRRAVWASALSQSPAWALLFSAKRNVHYVIIGGRDVKSVPRPGNTPGPARDRSDRAPRPPRPERAGERASLRRPLKPSASSIIVSGSCRQPPCKSTAVRCLATRTPGECRAHPPRDRTASQNLRPSQNHRGGYCECLRLLCRQRLSVFLKPPRDPRRARVPLPARDRTRSACLRDLQQGFGAGQAQWLSERLEHRADHLRRSRAAGQRVARRRHDGTMALLHPP